LKKPLIILGICGITALTACAGQNNMANDGIYERSGNTLNVNNQRADIYNRDNGSVNRNADFGYVRHQQSPIMGENVSNNNYTNLNREELANTISRYSSQVPNVADVSTLVTDREVLIVYATDTKDRNLTADQVKKMAMSIVPRWYHVYVSDNTGLRQNLENFATTATNTRNAHNGIDHLIKQMLKSPQGGKMSDGENQNGVMQGKTNNNNVR